jgi:hypothetical protein
VPTIGSDHDGVCVGQRVAHAGGCAGGEIALQHDALQTGADGLARGIGGVCAGLEDGQRGYAVGGRAADEFGRVGCDEQTIDGRAGEKVERLGVGVVPARGHPGGWWGDGSRQRQCAEERHPGSYAQHHSSTLLRGAVAKNDSRRVQERSALEARFCAQSGEKLISHLVFGR